MATAGKKTLAAPLPDHNRRFPISASASPIVPVPVTTAREAGSRKANTSAVPAGSDTSAFELDDANTVTRVRMPGEAPSKSPRPAVPFGPAPEVGAECVSSARSDLCGGRGVSRVPTATEERRLTRGLLRWAQE